MSSFNEHYQALRRLPLVLLAACALAPAARGEISIRDDGSAGIVFSSVGDADAAPAIQKISEQRTVALMPAKSATLRMRREQLGPLVTAAARAHDLPEALLAAVIEIESNFNVAAVSAKGALGLMQLMPQTARQLGVADARDPAANIDGGARYLKQLLGRFGNNLPLALAAYNAGPAAVLRSGNIPQFAETQLYVPRVIARYHRLQSGIPIR